MIVVLRIGHRYERDKRVTTHIGLVSRAFGADKVVITSPENEIIDNIKNVSKRFGGDFEVEITENWHKFLKNWNGSIVHLTMYGENLNKVIKEVPKDNLLIVIGAEKVPREVYEIADFNIAVGNQPHSEISALAVLLDRLLEGNELEKDFRGNVRILPSKKGKNVIFANKYPNYNDCLKLLKEAGCSPIIINHCETVHGLALKIANLCKENGIIIDIELIEAGALLHDIGRSRTHEIKHAIIGVKIAEKYGLDIKIINIIERHIGAGISKDETEKLGLPPKDYIPLTTEEKIIAHSDNLIANDTKQNINEAYEKLCEKGKEDVAKKILALHKELTELCNMDLDLI